LSQRHHRIAGACASLALGLLTMQGYAADAPSSGPAGLPKAPVPVANSKLARVLHVGPKGQYSAPSLAAAAARDGDTIEIAGGEYPGDVAVWTANRIKIVGVGGRPHIKADGRNAEGKGTWVIRGEGTLVDNVELSGSKVPDRNGAAIRLEGRNFVLRNSYIHDNENGLLTNPNPASEVLIDHCEFARNGGSEGQTHNVYVGEIGKLTVQQSYLHHAIVGHNLKSRAAVNVLSENRFADEADGRASYEVEFPIGGQVLMTLNVIQKGPNAENSALVSFGAEGLAQRKHEFIAKRNTFVGQRPNGSRFIVFAPGVTSIDISGNVFAGRGTLPEVSDVKANNTVQSGMPSNADWKPSGFRP